MSNDAKPGAVKYYIKAIRINMFDSDQNTLPSIGYPYSGVRRPKSGTKNYLYLRF
jgi:hypothetical protein